jgi:uncharacterized integral membrane protein
MRQEHDLVSRQENRTAHHPEVRESTVPQQRWRFRSGVIVGALAAAGAALLVIQNSHTSDFEWMWFDFQAPLWLLLLLTLLAGVAIGEAHRLLWRRSRSRSAERDNALGAARRRTNPTRTNWRSSS